MYEIKLYIENKPYITRVKIKRGPSDIEDITYEGESILDEIEPYMNISSVEFLNITPKDIGYNNTITLHTMTDKINIKSNEYIHKLKNQ